MTRIAEHPRKSEDQMSRHGGWISGRRYESGNGAAPTLAKFLSPMKQGKFRGEYAKVREDY